MLDLDLPATAPQPPEAVNAEGRNLLLLAQLRWIAVVGQVLTILIVHYGLDIDLPLVPMFGVVASLVVLNLASLERWRRGAQVTNGKLLLELLLDVAAFTVQIYLSGGATNPFISLYLLQVILGAVLLEVWATWLLVAITGSCFVALCVIYRPIALPHDGRGAFFGLHIQGMLFCFLLASCLAVLFVIRINRNLRARDAHLAELRRRSAEEDHVVRMGLLASGAAHELGTPLATLSVILSDWQRTPVFRDDAELAEDMAEMQVQLARCKSIVSGILMSAGEARGEGTVRTTLNHFLDDAVAEWRAARSPEHFDYTNVVAPDEPIVSDTAIKQVIFNILDNALEASPDWVGCTAGRHDGNLVLAVSDAGPGFAAEVLGALGKPYNTTKQRYGAGLGLFLVVNVMRKLGGGVTAKNSGEGGACVTLTLPLHALRGET